MRRHSLLGEKCTCPHPRAVLASRVWPLATPTLILIRSFRHRLMNNPNVGATHTGAFREWKEDFDTVEIFLPLPPATTKSELVCVITPNSLHIRHTRLQATLLVAQPLAGPVIPEDSTWYLEGGVLNLVLAKQWRGETKSDSNPHSNPNPNPTLTLTLILTPTLTLTRRDQERPVLGRTARSQGRHARVLHAAAGGARGKAGAGAGGGGADAGAARAHQEGRCRSQGDQGGRGGRGGRDGRGRGSQAAR